MSQFHVLPCDLSDVDSMVDIYIRAFSDEYLNQFTMPRATCSNAAKAPWLHDRFASFLSKPEYHVQKLVESSTGKMVAWSRWVYPHTLTKEEQEKRQLQKAQDEKDIKEGRKMEFPHGANHELFRTMFEGLGAMKEKYVKSDEMYVVEFLATDPDYQRRGLGSMLLKHDLAIADAENKRSYIEATAPGHPVYLKLGWKDVDLLVFDVEKWGGTEPAYHWIMIREPPPRLKA